MTPLTTTLLREMIERAWRATPGPWTQWVDHPDIYAGPVTRNTRSSIYGKFIRQIASTETCDLVEFEEDKSIATAAHIAACSPEVVIALCKIALEAKDCADNEDNEFPLTPEMRDALREAGMI